MTIDTVALIGSVTGAESAEISATASAAITGSAGADIDRPSSMSDLLIVVIEINELALDIQADEAYLKSIEMMDAAVNAQRVRLKIAADINRLIKLAAGLNLVTVGE